eukprot:TRINITY_DN5484_c0_g2_i1.p2 TRINITY_DN5484_c0_g2~~TRINITY_DN5484_c0_g2_i1.p2  ORF type:complete len:137 (-),score=6.23 TRINITY_DN5484_c0_g2_i1:290-700(-)
MKFSVNIQEDLVLQLARKRKSVPQEQGPTRFQQQQNIESHNEINLAEWIANDKELACAMHGRNQVGNLLLKREVGALQGVESMADNMINRYNRKKREMPCSTEEQELIQCLQKFKNDPFVCSPMIQSYKKCSQDLL